MIIFLAIQVMLGKITIEQVPEVYRADVQSLIDKENEENEV
jgi:hypothetical protein